MPRHLQVKRDLKYQKYSCSYDDEDGFDLAASPLSPSLQEYMVGGRSLPDGYEDVPPALYHIVKNDADCDLVLDAVSRLADAVDSSVSWPRMVELVRGANYDADAALEAHVAAEAAEARDRGHGAAAGGGDDDMFGMEMEGEPARPPGLAGPAPVSGVGAVLGGAQSAPDGAAAAARVAAGIQQRGAAGAIEAAAPPSFDFSTPSPDDAVAAQQCVAFRKGADAAAANAPAKGAAFQAAAATSAASPASPSGSSASASAPAPAPASDLRTSVDRLQQCADLVQDAASPKAKKAVRLRSAARWRELSAAVAARTAAEADGGGERKPLLNMVVTGHVDAGKSTVMGHLLHLLGHVSQRDMHKFEQEAKREGKASFAFAWVMDAHAEERSRGVTMDVAVRHFETPSKRVCLLDAPGHRDFVPNMITGAAQADVAVLVINSTTNEFEAGFSDNGQTKEHAILLRSLGVAQLLVLVNKMDTVEWAQERFDEIRAALAPFLKHAGFKESRIRYIPCSGFTGDNLTHAVAPAVCPWYAGGDTLVQAIDKFKVPARDVDKPLRLCISDVFKGNQGGSIVAGRVEAGVIAQGDTVAIAPEGQVCGVKALLDNAGKAAEWAAAGENIEVVLTGLDLSNVRVGSFVCDPEHVISSTARFHAQIITFDMRVPLALGHAVVLHTQAVNEPANITRMMALLDRASGEVVKRRPRCIPSRATASVELTLARPVCLELFSDLKSLGRFTLRHGGDTIAAGIVLKKFRRPRKKPAPKREPPPPRV